MALPSAGFIGNRSAVRAIPETCPSGEDVFVLHASRPCRVSVRRARRRSRCRPSGAQAERPGRLEDVQKFKTYRKVLTATLGRVGDQCTRWWGSPHLASG